MGSLVWTTPRQMRFQINRCDVYANDSTTTSFFERHNDYCGGCAYLDIEFDSAAPPFPASGFQQRLSVYDGVLQMDGKDLSAQVFVWPSRDVLVINVNDRRTSRVPASAVLRMLRFQTKYFGADLKKFARDHVNTVETNNHRATSQLIAPGKRIALTQEFQEREFWCNSTVAIAVVGRKARRGS